MALDNLVRSNNWWLAHLYDPNIRASCLEAFFRFFEIAYVNNINEIKRICAKVYKKERIMRLETALIEKWWNNQNDVLPLKLLY